MTKRDTDAGNDKLYDAEKAGATSAKIATESVTSEPQAQKYEPRFTSFSSNKSDLTLPADSPLQQLLNSVQRLVGPESGQRVSEFSIEDKDLGKLVTATGERSNIEPRQSFINGLKEISQSGDLSPERRERMLAEFSISYITRKTSEFFQGTATGIRDGLQKIVSPDNQSAPATQSGAPAETGPADGQAAMVQVGHRFYPADSIVANSNEIASDATPAAAEGTRTWVKPQNVPYGFSIWTDLTFGDDAKKAIAKEYVEGWRCSGEAHEVQNVPQTIVETYASLLNDPKRNNGEFNFAVGEKSGKLYMSRVWFNPGVLSNGAEIQEPIGANELSKAGVTVLSADHTHPLHKDKAYFNFSPQDLELGQHFDGDLHRTFLSNRNKTFVQCLLTPAPDNKVLLYEAAYTVPDKNYIEAAPRIKELGHFSHDGRFVPNPKETALLKKLGFPDQ